MKRPFHKRKFESRPRRENDRKKERGDKPEWRKGNGRPEPRDNRGANDQKRTGSGEKREWKKDERGGSESRPWKKPNEPGGRYKGRRDGGEGRGEKRPWKKPAEGDRRYTDKDIRREDPGSVRPWEKKDTTRWHGGRRDREKRREQNLKKAFDKSAKNSTLSSGPGSPQSSGPIRLNKYLSNAGICSRREADKFISAGVVTVNGKIITELGFKVAPGDRVQFGGNKVHKEKTVYILLNKPKGFITTCDDPEERDTVMDLIKDVPERIYPVGRLDRGTTGLLLLTNDGEMAKVLMHPKYKVAKVYHVELDRPLRADDLDKIRTGIELEDGFIRPDDVAYVDGAETKKEVGIEIHSGRNRIVRRIFESLGYIVIKLDRVFYAGLTKKTLSRGKWRYLEENEVRLLKKIR